ncbi:MAG: PEP-CTERM sorting domain-containing protein [Thermoguttaceae bacterium]|nr:PEP-CTERM sorting domain-containing protein [Thermoguttaceae bacterium]
MKNAYRFIVGLLTLTMVSWANADVVIAPGTDAATIVAPMSPDTTVWVQNTFGNEIELYSGTTSLVPSGSQGLMIGGTENTASIKAISNCLQNLGQTTVMNNGSLSIPEVDGTDNYLDNDLTVSGGYVRVDKSYYSMRNGANVTVSDGTLEFFGRFRVGYDSAATVDQTGGNVTLNTIASGDNKFLSIGYKSGANGQYNLSSGTLNTVPDIYIGDKSGAQGTLNMTGGTVNSSASLRVASEGTGTFILSAGEFNQTAGWTNIAYEASGKGQMIVNGGTFNYSSNDFRVGRKGEGVLKLEAGTINLGEKALVLGYYEGGTGEFTMTGGTLNAKALTLGEKVATETKPGAKGTATFTNGVNQTFPGNITVGNYGTGTLTVDNAVLNTAGYVYIGNSAGGTGELILQNGGNLSPTAHSTRVGEAGTGTFRVLAGSSYTGNEIYLGSTATGDGTLIVDGGMTQSKRIIVGNAGTGTMNTSNNASITITSGGFYVGGNEDTTNKPAGTGVATLTNTTLTVTDDIAVGNYGTGTLTLDGTTTATTNGYLYIANHTGSTGTVNIQNGASLSAPEHTVRIGQSGNGTMNVLTGGTFDSSAKDIHIGYNAAGSGTLTVDGGTVNSLKVYVGTSGTGELNVKAGSLSMGTNHIYVGNNAGATGTFNMSGGEVTIGDLRVGENGTGTANISGGTLSLNYIMYAGLNNQGTINISDSANVTVTGNIIAGYNTVPTEENDVKGQINVSGGNVTTNGNVLVGNQAGAKGEMNVSGGNVTASGNILVGNLAGTKGELNVSGGTLTGNGELRVGDSGDGTMNVTGGETTVAGLSNIAYAEGSTGKLTIQNGKVTLTNSGNTFRVGRYGKGTVEVLEGGQLNVTSTATQLGYYGGGEGTLTIDGGSAELHTLQVGFAAGATGNFNMLDGTLTITQTEINVGYNGTGYATISGGEVNLTSLRVGRENGSVGELTIEGDGVMNLSSAARISYNAGSQGKVFIKENGQMNVTKELTIGNSDVGYVEVSGGQLNANPIVIKENGSSMKITGGTVTTPALTTANRLEWTGGTLDAKAVTGDLTQNGGTYNPGVLQIVDATIAGNYTQSGDGTIVIDFNADNTDWDTITVNNGNINLGGTLFLNITNELNTLDTYPIFSVTGGNMDVAGVSVAFPDWYTGDSWMLNSAGILELGALPPGPVDPSVPEPATWALMLLGIAGLLYSRKRSRK